MKHSVTIAGVVVHIAVNIKHELLHLRLYAAKNIDNTGSFRKNTHNIIALYAPWENFYAPGVAALCSVFHAVFVQVVVRTREHD